jgi:hypothetical protein
VVNRGVRLFRLAVVSLCFVAGCGGDSGEAGLDASLADGSPVDSSASVDGSVGGCSETSSRATIGPEGGSLEMCGAWIAVDPGSLKEPIEFAISIDVAPDPPAPRDLAGPAFRFTAGDSTLLPASVDVALPHGGREGRIELFRVEGEELVGIEPCTVDDEIIGQRVGALGTFVATVDSYPYADSPGDLGTGNLSVQIGERMTTYSLPEDGYAIDQAWDALVSMTVLTDLVSGPGGDEQLRVDATVSDGEAVLVYLQWYSEGLIWQLGTPEAPGTTGSIEVESMVDGRLIGSMSASLYAGDDTTSFSAEFDLAPDYWSFPPERFCAGGEARTTSIK